MTNDIASLSDSNLAPDSATDQTAPSPSDKRLRPVFDTLFALPPNRETLGGTSYLILESAGNILVDCPPWDEFTHTILQKQGGVRWLFLTHRDAIARAGEIQQAFGCQVLIQEQEAYLLPNLEVRSFQDEFSLSPTSQAIWTSGHSPGSACLYHAAYGGILFTGRHLLPNQQGEPVPLRISKTFHWRRQIDSIRKLRDRFTSETLHYICPGANTGFLRGSRSIDRAYERLMAIDLDACLFTKPML